MRGARRQEYAQEERESQRKADVRMGNAAKVDASKRTAAAAKEAEELAAKKEAEELSRHEQAVQKIIDALFIRKESEEADSFPCRCQDRVRSAEYGDTGKACGGAGCCVQDRRAEDTN